MLKNLFMYLGLLIVLAVSIYLFYDSFVFEVWQVANLHVVSDLPKHTELVVKFAEQHSFPAYSLWYRLAYSFAGFSAKYTNIAYASIALLAVLVGAKYIIAYRILRNSCTDEKIVALISLVLIIVMPVASYYTCKNHLSCAYINEFHVYLGNIAPNVWHNATLILAMPFNLLLFYYSVKNIHSENLYTFLGMGGLSVISILSKPNYALAFLPVLCVTILILNIKWQQYSRAIIKCLLVAVPSILTLLYQWYFTFIIGDAFTSPTKTIFAPFLVWSAYSPHIALSLLLSIVFPLLVIIFYFKRLDFYLSLSWLTFIVALSMLVFLAEYPNWIYGDYFWGAIAANFILFLFSANLLLSQPVDWKSKVSYAALGIHFLSGCFYLGSFFIRQTSLLL